MFVTRKALDAMDTFLQESHKPYILHPGQLLQPQTQLRGNEDISVTRILLLIVVPRLFCCCFFLSAVSYEDSHCFIIPEFSPHSERETRLWSL